MIKVREPFRSVDELLLQRVVEDPNGITNRSSIRDQDDGSVEARKWVVVEVGKIGAESESIV
jgi:hypothetical protein